MIDFRYHAMSLAAVFVALALGLLLGVTLGDTNLISDARGGLETSLKKHLNETRAESGQRQQQIDQQNQFLSIAYPQLVRGTMNGERVATIGSADVAQNTLKAVTGAVEPAGANVVYIAQLLAKPEYTKIAAGLGVPGLLSADQPSVSEANQLGRDRTTMRRLVFSRLSGTLMHSRLFAYARQQPADADTDAGKVYNGFESGIVAGLAQQADRVAGVENATTVPSNIKWYNALGLSSVDNIDQWSGHYSLVQIFTGAKGDFGVKGGADSIIPQVEQ